MLLKDDAEHPVPEEWRPKFRLIADAFAHGDFQLRANPIVDVAPIDPTTAEHFAANVSKYGEGLDPLDDRTWGWSVYRWMDGYWQFAVDLTTQSVPVSDLTLHARVYENAGGYRVVVEGVYAE